MSDLSDFLLARIAADEAVARAASPGPWHVDTESATVLAVDDIEVCDGFALSGPQLRATTRHIAHHDPARVLAECEAKRRIVKEHYFMPGHESRDFGFADGNCVTCRTQGPCVTLLLLALPYVDHPDFRDEWRP